VSQYRIISLYTPNRSWSATEDLARDDRPGVIGVVGSAADSVSGAMPGVAPPWPWVWPVSDDHRKRSASDDLRKRSASGILRPTGVIGLVGFVAASLPGGPQASAACAFSAAPPICASTWDVDL